MTPAIKFAVQREDPRLEEKLLDRMPGNAKRFFGITAAGCTLLQLSARTDLIDIVGADFDPRQTAWAHFRFLAARMLNRRDFCRVTGISQIDQATREALFNRVVQALPPDERAFFKAERAFFVGGAFDAGTFERVFACWRGFVEKFVASEDDLERFFAGDRSVAEAILGSELWPISFELSFHQALLTALFGHNAIQHAPPGSYPRYFRARFEWALRQPDAPANPYLSHVLRGRYGALDRPEAVPDYLTADRYDRVAQGIGRVALVTGNVAEALAARPGPYQLIQLSNILDWSSEAESAELAAPVLEHLAPGGYLLVRQLNNVRPLPQAWTKALEFDLALERELQAIDRSFFYSAIRVGRKPA